MILKHQLDIGAPIEEAFSWIQDPAKQKEWIEGLTGTTWLDEVSADDPVGTKFRWRMEENGKVREIEGEVIEYYRPNIYGVHLNYPNFTFENIFRLESLTTRSCRLHYKCTIASQEILAKTLGSLYLLKAQTKIKKQLKKLVTCIEKNAHK
jgi:hypothetical protein